ncbi:GGDEF domain-containing protein [Paenibacillus dakarensis]|uniref:GGDEF domain-containing protein n=1 Tax=Paenibacillus dakarensis TaxID=1527293 RepID=UPI0006D5A6B2|nr:GGDEF domain-containing protein [Paenibacillus dakarensis]
MKWKLTNITTLGPAVIYLFIQLIVVLWLPEAEAFYYMLGVTAPFGVAIYLGYISGKHRGPLRFFWLLVVLALICEGARQLVWSIHDWSKGEHAHVLGSAELIWILEAILLAAGLVYLFHQEQGLLRSLRFLFDIIIMFIVFITISFEYILKPQFPNAIQSGNEIVLWFDLAYAVWGIILIFFTMVLYVKAKQVSRWAVAYVCLGGSVYVIGNLLYLMSEVIEGIDPSPIIHLFWTAAVFLIGMAGTYSAFEKRTEKGSERQRSEISTFIVKYLLPYAVLAGLIVLISHHFGGWNGLFTGLSLSVLLILLRQMLIQLENDRLLDRLHQSLKQSEYLAHHDDLTGLYNRRYFNTRLIERLAKADKQGSRLGLLYMDLNQFKRVNDNYGHHAGDQLIQMVAQRLMSLDSDRLTCSRLGGDEFTVIVYPAAGDEELIELAERISDLLKWPYQLEEHAIHTSSSIGLAVYPDHASNDQELIGRADSAMYAAKERGAKWQIYVKS